MFVVLGLIARLHGFSLWKFLKYIKEELLIVLGTSSSEAALPRMILKLEEVGLREIGGRVWWCPRVIRSTWTARRST